MTDNYGFVLSLALVVVITQAELFVVRVSPRKTRLKGEHLFKRSGIAHGSLDPLPTHSSLPA